VAAPPASRLLGTAAADVPFRPKLAGNLVPANVNVWMGNSRDGSTSGLHHDHHDNMYVLLRGRKKFELYSPAEVGSMYTVGHPTRVHANGRINYEESGATAADGDDGAVSARVAAGGVRSAEAELEAAEEAVEEAAAATTAGGGKEYERAKRRLKLAEAALDEAMDAVMDGGSGGGGGGDDDDDDDDDAMFFGAGMRDDFDDVDVSDSDLNQRASSSSDDDDDDDDAKGKGKGKRARHGGDASAADDEDDDGDPPSFSRVDRARVDAFPLFRRARDGGARVEAEVAAGEVGRCTSKLNSVFTLRLRAPGLVSTLEPIK
jgi:hypothetical protein